MTGSTLAIWRGSPNHYTGRYGHGIAYITEHIMQGGLPGSDTVFQRSSSMASANYGIGVNGEIWQWVGEQDGSWADGTPASNCSAITIEHAGGLDGYPNTDACVEASACLHADIARRMGWPRLEHGVNVFLHREIPPHTHPNCPDLCANPLRWQEIIDRANHILQGTPVIDKGDIMAIVYGSDQFAGLKYWDGVNPPVGISNQSQLQVLQTNYKASTGRDLPLITYNGPWAVEAEQAMVSASQQARQDINQRLDNIEAILGKLVK